ncbi:hypothetical protein WJX82_007211 [Trebouxia sp. C0006]
MYVTRPRGEQGHELLIFILHKQLQLYTCPYRHRGSLACTAGASSCSGTESSSCVGTFCMANAALRRV